MAAHASGDRLRFQWAVELEKERKALADQIIEIKRNEQLLKAKLAEVDQLPAGEIRPQPSEKRRTDSEQEAEGSASCSSSPSAVNVTLFPEPEGSMVFQARQFLKDQRRQLKKRMKQIVRAQREWKTVAGDERQVRRDLSAVYASTPSSVASGDQPSSLEQTLLDAVELQTENQADAVVALSHALALLADRSAEHSASLDSAELNPSTKERTPLEPRSSARAERSKTESKAAKAGTSERRKGGRRVAEGKENSTPGRNGRQRERRESRGQTQHAYHWAPMPMQPTYGHQACAGTVGVAALVAPDYPHPSSSSYWQHAQPHPSAQYQHPVRAYPHRPLYGAWEDFQVRQQNLIRNQSDWLRSFKERVAYGAGPYYHARPMHASPLPVPTGGMFQHVEPRKAGREVRVRRDAQSGGAVVMLDDHTELKISISRR